MCLWHLSSNSTPPKPLSSQSFSLTSPCLNSIVLQHLLNANKVNWFIVCLLHSEPKLHNYRCLPWLVLSFSSVQFSCSVMSDSLRPHGLQHARPPCPSLTPGVYSNSCPLSWWCHPTTSSSVVPFSSHLQSFPASGSFQMSQFFASGNQNIGVSASASVLPMNIQD